MEELKESQIVESDFDEINEKLEDVQDTVNSIHQMIVTARINDYARKTEEYMEENTLTNEFEKTVERVDGLEKLAVETLSTINDTHNIAFRIEMEMEREASRKQERHDKIKGLLSGLFLIAVTILSVIGVVALFGMVN